MRKLMVLFVLLAACGGDKTTDPTQVNFAGTFTLRTVNGSGLPYVVAQSGQNSVTINSDQLTIADGGTWSEVGTFTVKTNGQNATQTATDQGTWFRSGASLTLNSTASKSTAYGGTFTSSQLNLLDGSVNTYVFTK